jgi:agmatinase
VVPIPKGRPTFIDAPACADLGSLDADIAVIGVPYGVPYDMYGSTSPSSAAPRTIREQSQRYVPLLSHYDFDFSDDLFAGREVKIVDCGDVAMLPGDYEGNLRKTTAAIAEILRRGAVPFVLGGDHAIPVPVFRAYEGFGSMCVVQLDAHLDWRDEINGVRDGLSSQMRRASEMTWVSGTAQIGLRGLGSGRHQEYADARTYGSVLVGADELHQVGVANVLSRVPTADRYYITFDADGLDPTVAPGVGGPGPGGITYYEAFHLLRGIAAKGKVVGFDFVEVVPSLDVHDMTSMVAARLILTMIGAMAHTGQIGRTK